MRRGSVSANWSSGMRQLLRGRKRKLGYEVSEVRKQNAAVKGASGYRNKKITLPKVP